MCLKWNKWALNEGDSNLGHMPYFKNYIIPPSLKLFNIIIGWENGHLNSISFILSSFCIRMTIKWPKSHLEMAQNDRDGPGMKVIKMLDIWLDIMNISFIYHSVIPASSCNDLSLRKQIQDMSWMTEDLTLKKWIQCCLL